jgi:hypothetical protein
MSGVRVDGHTFAFNTKEITSIDAAGLWLRFEGATEALEPTVRTRGPGSDAADRGHGREATIAVAAAKSW